MSLSKEWVNTELSNSEFEVLEEFLEKLPHILAPGGRVAILTFHSGEDRLVKKIWKRQQKEGLWSEVAKNVIRPSKEECHRNGRARSTKTGEVYDFPGFCLY